MRLYDHLTEHVLLDNRPGGIRTGYSTVKTSVYFTEDLCAAN